MGSEMCIRDSLTNERLPDFGGGRQQHLAAYASTAQGRPLHTICFDCWTKVAASGAFGLTPASQRQFMNISKKAKWPDFSAKRNAELLWRLQGRGALADQSLVFPWSKEEILAKLEQRDKQLLLAAGDFNPCLGRRFFILYACAGCGWGPIVQSAWYLVLTPNGTLCWHCATCGKRYRWGEGAPHRALVLCWVEASGDRCCAVWRMGPVSEDTEADIVVLRALVLYNSIENTTVKAILEGLQRLNLSLIHI